MNMKWDDYGLKASLARAKGLGSARDGVGHWMHQRITALALFPLTIWFVLSILSLMGSDYGEFTAWLSAPVNAILTILFLVSVFTHAALGLQVVIEDYVHHEGCKVVKLILVKLVFFALAVASIFSVLKVGL